MLCSIYICQHNLNNRVLVHSDLEQNDLAASDRLRLRYGLSLGCRHWGYISIPPRCSTRKGTIRAGDLHHCAPDFCCRYHRCVFDCRQFLRLPWIYPSHRRDEETTRFQDGSHHCRFAGGLHLPILLDGHL